MFPPIDGLKLARLSRAGKLPECCTGFIYSFDHCRCTEHEKIALYLARKAK